MYVLHVQRSAQHSSGGGEYEDTSMRICNNQAVAAENRITVRNLSLLIHYILMVNSSILSIDYLESISI